MNGFDRRIVKVDEVLPPRPPGPTVSFDLPAIAEHVVAVAADHGINLDTDRWLVDARRGADQRRGVALTGDVAIGPLEACCQVVVTAVVRQVGQGTPYAWAAPDYAVPEDVAKAQDIAWRALTRWAAATGQLAGGVQVACSEAADAVRRLGVLVWEVADVRAYEQQAGDDYVLRLVRDGRVTEYRTTGIDGEALR